MTLFTPPVAGSYTATEGWIPGVHRSLDFAVPVGTPVLAAGSGVVTQESDFGAMGDTLRIKHPNGYTTLYGNMSSYRVSVGQSVSQGQQIGTSGGAVGSKDAGDSTGPHLPFQVWKNGIPVNPAPLVGVTPGSKGSGIETASDTNPLDALNPFAGLQSDFAAVGVIGSWASDSGNWVRVGLGVLGTALLIIAVIKLVGSTPTGKAAISTATSAAKVALLA